MHRFEKGEEFIFPNDINHVHAAAEILKKYLRELPDPLLGRSNYSALISIGKSKLSLSLSLSLFFFLYSPQTAQCNGSLTEIKIQEGSSSEEIGAIRQIVEGLPISSRDCLAVTMMLFRNIASNTQYNKMSTKSVAVVVAPSMLNGPEGQDSLEALSDMQVISNICQLLIEKYDEIFPNLKGKALEALL